MYFCNNETCTCYALSRMRSFTDIAGKSQYNIDVLLSVLVLFTLTRDEFTIVRAKDVLS